MKLIVCIDEKKGMKPQHVVKNNQGEPTNSEVPVEPP